MANSPITIWGHYTIIAALLHAAIHLARIQFLGEITAGRVIFGEPDCEPILGITARESVGIMVDPATKTLKRLPAIPLK